MNVKIRHLPLVLLFWLPAMVFSQHTAVKTNLLYLTTGTLNIGLEQSLSKQWTVHGEFNDNPWLIYSGKTSLRHMVGNFGLRYYPCRAFTGWYFGAQGLLGKFNVHNLPLINKPKDYSLKGNGWGAGISAGYHLPLSGRWGMEFGLDVSFVRFKYDEMKYPDDGTVLKSESGRYYGPTRIAIALVYLLD